MMRRPPTRAGLGGKKASGTGFKITYSVNQLLSMGKELMESEAGCPPPEGWDKYEYNTIGPLIDENNTRIPSKEEAAALKMKPGSARDLHSEHIAALVAKQGADPDQSPSLGPRGGGDRPDRDRGGGGGRADGRRDGQPGWGDRDRDWDRFGDRNKDRDRGGPLGRYDQERERRDGRRDRPRDGP
ncbi:unnamed protein product, partial [Ectocarpus sp. 13 AM-2016]